MGLKEKICDLFNIDDIGDFSDGFHTFNQLYHQRMMLFAVIVKQNKSRAWKSLKHEDGEYCFGGGWFIVGIDTPEGSYTYHYKTEYYDLFDCQELPTAKHWDGHTEKDVTRLLSLEKTKPNEWTPVTEGLPKELEVVLITNEKGNVRYGQFRGTGGDCHSWYWKGNTTEKVLAWMPKPKPFEVKEK